MPEAAAAQDGYMPKEAFAKLDGIEAGSGVNVDLLKSMQLLLIKVH